MNKEISLREIESLVSFFEDLHSCDEDNTVELPHGNGWGCTHMLHAERALQYITTKLT